MVAVEADDSELDCLRDEVVELDVGHHSGIHAKFEEGESGSAGLLCTQKPHLMKNERVVLLYANFIEPPWNV